MWSEHSFGKYRLVHRLAYGGMAEVFLARASGAAGFEKNVVIKRLHPQFSADRDFVTMLIDEAHIASQLTHTNICQVLDLGEVDGTYYLALEYIEGRDLFSIMRTLRRSGHMLPIPAAVYVINEVLEGLGFAHRKCGQDGHPLGIVHRDVSPQNVLITGEGEVKIIDFGIAKARINSSKTQAGILKGKYRYMAPEQAEGRAVDARTDLFSTGIVLYELLAGQVHGRGLSDMQLLERVRSAHFEPLRSMRPEVPPVLEEIVLQALERDPARRFQSAHEFQDALSGFLHATGLEFAKRDLGALVRGLFPEPAPAGRPLDENQTATGTPSARLSRSALSAAEGTTIEHEEELEELDAGDLEEVDDGGAGAPRPATPRPAFRDAPTVERGSQRAAPAAAASEWPPPAAAPVEALPPAAVAPPGYESREAAAPVARVRRVVRPARREAPRESFRESATVDLESRGGSRPAVGRDLGLRAPAAEPFAPEPPEPTPPRGSGPHLVAPTPVRPTARRGVTAARSPAPAPAPAPAPPPPVAAEPAARPSGLSRSGKLAAFLTVLLLGGTAVGVLFLYRPDKYLPRHRATTAAVVTGALYVTSKPAGAAISIDGKPTLRRTPDTVDGLPVNRPIRLELALDGYQPWSLEVSVSADAPTPVMAELTREGGGRGPARERGRPRGSR